MKIQRKIQRKFQLLILLVQIDCLNRLRINLYMNPMHTYS